MKQEKPKMKLKNIKDIERAAWFARLAFGTSVGKNATVPNAPKKTAPVFHVMP